MGPRSGRRPYYDSTGDGRDRQEKFGLGRLVACTSTVWVLSCCSIPRPVFLERNGHGQSRRILCGFASACRKYKKAIENTSVLPVALLLIGNRSVSLLACGACGRSPRALEGLTLCYASKEIGRAYV